MNQSQPDLSELAEEVESAPEDLEALLGDSAEEEEEEEGEEAEGDEPEADQNPDDWKSRTYVVKGEEVSGHEMEAGYMKDADYRQKTEKTAQSLRETTQEREAIQQERNYYANRLGVLISSLEQDIVGDQAVLSRLAVENPAAWVAKQNEMGVKSQKLNAAYQNQQMLAQRNQEADNAYQQQYSQQEYQALISKIPAWRDETVATKEQREIVEFGISQGYTADELADVLDHRALLILRKAMMNDKRAALKPTPTQGRTVHPNAATPNPSNRTNQSDLRKVMQHGSKDQRIGALAKLLG